MAWIAKTLKIIAGNSITGQKISLGRLLVLLYRASLKDSTKVDSWKGLIYDSLGNGLESLSDPYLSHQKTPPKYQKVCFVVSDYNLNVVETCGVSAQFSAQVNNGIVLFDL